MTILTPGYRMYRFYIYVVYKQVNILSLNLFLAPNFIGKTTKMSINVLTLLVELTILVLSV